jgi:hypothetical protein
VVRIGLSFSRRRVMLFAALVALALFFLFAALHAALVVAVVPLLGAVLVFAGFMAWYVPALCLTWTSAFTFTDFWATANGWPGVALVILFYALPSAIVAFVRVSGGSAKGDAR